MIMITKLIQAQRGLRAFGWITACVLATGAMAAQTSAPRIRSEVNNSAVTTLKASQQPLAQVQNDAGPMPSNMKLNGMTITFNRSAAQQADLEALLAAQQDPRSPQYHQWLNPDQFAARFGMAQSDINKVQTWLEQQGFSVDGVARSRNMIRFSGTIGQVDQAFQTQMHYYKTDGQTHFGPSTLLSVPAAIAPTIEAVRNLSDFRPRPMHISTHRAFTSSQSGNVFLAPGDIAVTYDIKPLYSAGIDGTGQSIAIIGQSAIKTSDIEAFQAAAGLPTKDPVMVIVPGSGNSTVLSGGDEGESDLDVEWSGAIAKGATIQFVYTGNSTNYNAFNALEYAIDEKIAPIISVSYGACETALNGFSLETAFQQAAAQGQSIFAASGDQGSTACSGDTQNGITQTQEFALAVNYPASSPYVTGVGGTEITPANSVSTNSTYWTGQGSSDTLTSAVKYIPEIVWNDDSTQFGLGATGGGASALFTKPSWQAGVPGIPSDGKRDVPDVSLYSSAAYPGYLFCTSDSSNWNTTQAPVQQASCNSGFRDNATGDLTVAGGTSFATPIFAGMMALINQKQQWTGGQGVANKMLYQLASDAGTYASAFHDVTSGNNNCTSGTQYCGTTTGGFKAAAGYDQATGLGSVDLANLVSAWPANASPLLATTTTVSAASGTPDVSTGDIITITVAEAGGSGTPTGTVNLSIDGGGTGYSGSSGTTKSVTLGASGTATYTANFGTTGVHTIVAQYAGDSTHSPSTGSVFVTIGGGTSGKGNFTLALTPATLTVKQGSQGNETLTVTPAGGYTGTLNFQYSTSNDTALTNLCVLASTGFDQNNSVSVTGSAAVTGTITIDTNAADCVSTTGGGVIGHGMRVIPHAKGSLKAANNTPKKGNPLPMGIAFAGLLVAGFLGKSSRKLRNLACLIALASLGLVLSACGGSVRGNRVSDPAKGSYTITFSGADSTNTALTAQSSFTLVIN
jgi:subtilase family serine protease